MLSTYLIVYLLIAVFAASFGVAAEFTRNPLIGAIWGLGWPVMLLILIFHYLIRR